MTRARETSENARLAKAWVNFNGTFGTSPFTEANGGIRSAFNVSSVVDNGTGDYTVNFTNAMSDANYTALMTTDDANSSVYAVTVNPQVYNILPGSIRLETTLVNSVTNRLNFDNTYIFVLIFR